MLGLKRFFAIIIGCVFLFSGFTKIVDPTGTGLIVAEYFKWMHCGFMTPAAKTLGMILSLTEMFTGSALLCGVWRRFTAIFASCLIAFFTLVSIALFILDPSIECGCFGQMIHMSHMQTMVKNFALCIMAAIAFSPAWFLGVTPRHKYCIFAIQCTLIAAFAVHTSVNVPYYDMTAYAPSKVIIAPWEESFDEATTTTLPLYDEYGEDASAEILEGDIALISIYDAAKLSQSEIIDINRFAAAAANQGYMPYILETELNDISTSEAMHLYADYKTLITLNRSNGGATLLRDGFIVDKCSLRNLYTEKELEAIIEMGAEDYSVHKTTIRDVVFQGTSLLFFILAVL